MRIFWLNLRSSEVCFHISLTCYSETWGTMGSLLRLLPQILQLTTILCICLFLKWISRMYSIIGHMGPVSCYIIMMDVVFLNHLVLCCDVCAFSRLCPLSHEAHVHPDSIPPAALHWLSSYCVISHLICCESPAGGNDKGRKRNQRFSLLSSNELPWAEHPPFPLRELSYVRNPGKTSTHSFLI